MTRLPIADRGTVRRALRDMISRHRRAVGVVLALHSAAALAGLAPPWLLGVIIDRVTAGAGVATVDRLALAIAGCVLVSALLSRYAQYAGHRFGERAVAELREEFVSAPSGCRSRSSSAPAPVTWRPAARSTWRRSGPPSGRWCPPSSSPRCS